MKNTKHTSNNSSEVIKQETAIEISVFEQAIYQQEQQFQIGIKNLIKPKSPIFKRRPANNTEPSVEASTWASGNQICKGKIGTFNDKGKKNIIQKNFLKFT